MRMLAKVMSAAVVGLDAVPITVEVDIAAQWLLSFTKVGTSLPTIPFEFTVPLG